MTAARKDSPLLFIDNRAWRVIAAAEEWIRGANRWTMRSSSLDTFMPFTSRAQPPQTPAMPRPAVQLGVLDGQVPRENAAVVQGCVPLVLIDGDSYRMRGHRAKLAQLRQGLGGANPG